LEAELGGKLGLSEPESSPHGSHVRFGHFNGRDPDAHRLSAHLPTVMGGKSIWLRLYVIRYRGKGPRNCEFTAENVIDIL